MRKFIQEWAPQEAVLMALPNNNTDWAYILHEAQLQYARIIETLTKEGVRVVLLCDDIEEAEVLLKNSVIENVTFINIPYNDTWTRDYGPISVIKDDTLRALDFGFNGWGLKFASDKDNLVNLHLSEKFVMLPATYRNERDFVLEGGSIETDGNGTLLTTTKCLCSPNRNGGLSKKEAEEELRHRLGVDHVLFLDYGALEGDDTDSHIDTLARIAPDNTIIFTGCRNIDDPQFEELLKMRAQLSLFRNACGEPFNLIELPLPDAIFNGNLHCGAMQRSVLLNKGGTVDANHLMIGECYLNCLHSKRVVGRLSICGHKDNVVGYKIVCIGGRESHPVFIKYGVREREFNKVERLAAGIAEK